MKNILQKQINIANYSIFFIIIFFSLTGYAQQELKICAIRVSFQADQNSLTTGDGTFLMDTSDVEAFTIDPPPHNKRYFQDQIIAVNNYFKQASKGQLSISGDVFPAGLDSSYPLQEEMNYYNPNGNEIENNKGLAQLLVDAVKLADNDPVVDLSQYNLITVFHAGVGKDINVGFDRTPQDIPSLYLSLNFLKNVFGNNYQGIIVNNGNDTIPSGIILPETESQEDIQIALTGIFASNIASHLGMLDLFSPSEQLTAIGMFGLMDMGQFNALGLLPALPTAYSRIIAGWENPDIVNKPTNNIEVNRFRGESTTGNSIIKVPVNSDEYFLLEYRGERNINIDSAYIELLENRTEVPTYLEVLQNYIPDKIKVSDSTGVLLKVDNYDWGLPGAGILIWHIDEKVISEKRNINRVNDDLENRGIDLEEADGSQDIGFTYAITEPGYRSESGTWLDFWFKNNTIPPLYKNEFSPSSSPNTLSNRNYANSHVILNNFSNNYGDVMTFDFSRDFFEEGFPISLNRDKNEKKFSSLKGGKISADSSIIVTSDDEGNVFAITKAGSGIFSDTTSLFAKFIDQTTTDLALADRDNDNYSDLLIVSSNPGYVTGYTFVDSDNDLLADTLFNLNTGSEIICPIVVSDTSFTFFVATDDNKITKYNFQGDSVDSYIYQSDIKGFVITNNNDGKLISFNTIFDPIVVDLNGDGISEEIFFPDSSNIEINNPNEKKIHSTDFNINGMSAIADIDLDGYYEILYHSDQSINGINYNGSYMTNLPIKPVLEAGEKLIGTPIIADINDDGGNDIISITNQGQLFAHNLIGDFITGFPTSIGSNVDISPILLDIDSDGKLEIFALNKKGDLHGWQIDSDYSAENLWWTQENYSSDNNLNITRQISPVGFKSTELLPSTRVYNFPNPNNENYTYIRYYLSEQSDVNVKIFDLAGDIVDDFSGPGSALIDHQIKWDLTDVSSGIYLCRVEAKSTKSSDVKIIKIMVVH